MNLRWLLLSVVSVILGVAAASAPAQDEAQNAAMFACGIRAGDSCQIQVRTCSP